MGLIYQESFSKKLVRDDLRTTTNCVSSRLDSRRFVILLPLRTSPISLGVQKTKFDKMADGGEETGDTITLRVKDQTGDEMFFKVKKNTKMQVLETSNNHMRYDLLCTDLNTCPIFDAYKKLLSQKIFDAFAQRKGIGAGSLRFMLDGERLKAEQTPKILELEDNDQIDVVLEMTGGVIEGPESVVELETLELRVRDQTGDEMYFKVKKGTKFQKIFDAYAMKRGVPSATLRFMHDGERITPDQSPKTLELENDEQIDVFLQTVGGVFSSSSGSGNFSRR